MSRDLQANCVISFYFCLYLVLHTCAARFDVTENLEIFLDFGGNLVIDVESVLHSAISDPCWEMHSATPSSKMHEERSHAL